MAAQSELAVADWPEWPWYEAMDRLLSEVISDAQTTKRPGVELLYPFLDSVSESVATLRSLMLKTSLRDAYVIARVIYETSLNACFLLTDVEALSARARVHAKQKALRSLVRAIEISGEQIFQFKPAGAEDYLQLPQHQEWMDAFTSKAGREITSWTPETVQKRLELVYEKFGSDVARGLAFGLLIYRHASEIAHGTLFGTLFSWGGTEIGSQLTCPEDIGRFRRKELRSLTKLVAYSLESVVRIASLELGNEQRAIAATEARLSYYQSRSEGA